MNEMHSSNPLHVDANSMFKFAISKVPNTQMGQIVVKEIHVFCEKKKRERKHLILFHLIQIIQLGVVDFIYSQMTSQRFPFALIRTLISMVKKSALAR